jgi:hypothetical protein
MKVEKVRVLKTLKLGSKVFQQGKLLAQPIPAEILKELASGADTLEVVQVSRETKPAPPTTKDEEVPSKRKLVNKRKKNDKE